MFQLVANSLTERVSQAVVSTTERLGEPGAGLLIALENLFPPLPSELILPLTGFTASQGDLNLVAAIAWTTLGSLTGALVLYGAGAWLGRDRFRSLAKKIPLVKLSDIDKTERWFRTHEAQTVFWGRLLPIFRSLISIPAGIERMPLPTFIMFTLAGSVIWNSLLIGAGYLLGEQWHLVEQSVNWLQKLVIITLIIGLLVFVMRRLRARRKKPNSS